MNKEKTVFAVSVKTKHFLATNDKLKKKVLELIFGN